MGSTYSAGLNESVEAGWMDLRKAILVQLRSNHYPPVPTSMVQPCLDAIRIIQDAQYGDAEASELVKLPEGITWRGNDSAPAYAIVESHHLEPFIRWVEE